VFRAAGLDQASFTPVDAEWVPRDFGDSRAAWEGPSSGSPGVRLRVEAAAYRGRVVSVNLVGPWARPRAQQPPPPSSVNRALRTFALTFWWTVLAGAMLLARQNLR
jgi:hypothetical protein